MSLFLTLSQKGECDSPLHWNLILSQKGECDSPLHRILILSRKGECDSPLHWNLILSQKGECDSPLHWNLILSRKGECDSPLREGGYRPTSIMSPSPLKLSTMGLSHLSPPGMISTSTSPPTFARPHGSFALYALYM